MFHIGGPAQQGVWKPPSIVEAGVQFPMINLMLRVQTLCTQVGQVEAIRVESRPDKNYRPNDDSHSSRIFV